MAAAAGEAENKKRRQTAVLIRVWMTYSVPMALNRQLISRISLQQTVGKPGQYHFSPRRKTF
jgi:hypothetical protein